MSGAMKSIYATITNHVQMVGYREIVEAHGRARGLAGLSWMMFWSTWHGLIKALEY